MPHKKLKDCPDVFIYLTRSDGTHISYIRKKAIEFSDVKVRADFFEFKAEPSFHKIKDNEAGIFKLRLAIKKADEWKDPSNGNWDKTVMKPPPNKWITYLLRANIY